jgi:hypothetical protein
MKLKGLIILILLAISTTIYIVSDSKLYYYGISDFNIEDKTLPLKLKPDFWSSDVSYPIIGFAITDELNMLVIGKGKKWHQNNKVIETKEIVKYGFDNKSLVAFIEATDNKFYYVEYAKNTDSTSKRELLYTVFPRIDLEKYKWIDVKTDEKKVSQLAMFRTYSILLFIVPSFIILLGGLILRKAGNLEKG